MRQNTCKQKQIWNEQSIAYCCNSSPSKLRHCDSFEKFKRLLKTRHTCLETTMLCDI